MALAGVVVFLLLKHEKNISRENRSSLSPNIGIKPDSGGIRNRLLEVRAKEKKPVIFGGMIAAVVPEIEPVPEPEVYQLCEADTPDMLVKMVVNALSDENSFKSVKDGSWDLELSHSSRENAARCYVKKGRGRKIILRSWFSPSLTRTDERILAGSVYVSTDSLAAVKAEQANMTGALKNLGFEIDVTTRPAWEIEYSYRKEVKAISKGSLTGDFFHTHNDDKTKYHAIMNVRHADMRSFAVIPEYALYPFSMPGKLFEELDKKNAAEIFGAETWVKIKYVIQNYPQDWGRVAPGADSWAWATALLSCAYTDIETEGMGRKDKAAYLLLKNHIASRMVWMAISEAMNQEREGKGEWQEGDFLPTLEELARLKIEYSVWGVEIGFSYSNEFRTEAATDFADTFWGQYAFTKCMRGGCGGMFACENGDPWDATVKEGKKFVEKHPDSPFSAGVFFLMGRAEETAYSTGLSPNDGRCVAYSDWCSEVAKSSDTHRQKAIEYYEKALSKPDGKIYEKHLAAVLPRLRSGSATR